MFHKVLLNTPKPRTAWINMDDVEEIIWSHDIFHPVAEFYMRDGSKIEIIDHLERFQPYYMRGTQKFPLRS